MSLLFSLSICVSPVKRGVDHPESGVIRAGGFVVGACLHRRAQGVEHFGVDDGRILLRVPRKSFEGMALLKHKCGER